MYVNNTSDNSVKILEKIGQNHPVTYTVADSLIEEYKEIFSHRTNQEFLTGNPIQAKCYIDAYENVDTKFYSHIAYLDIDEFLHPHKTLSDLLSPNSKLGSDIVKISWFNLAGDVEPFMPLNKTRRGTADIFFKSIVRTGISNLRVEDPHTCSVDGTTGKFSNDAIILHRVLRSKKEYLFLLARSTANKKDILTNGFKRNRRGWTIKASDVYVQNFEVFQNYEQNLQSFLNDCGIVAELETARRDVLIRYEEIVENLQRLKQQNNELIRSLMGTGLTHVSVTSVILQRTIYRIIGTFFPNLVLNHIELKNYLKKMIKRK